MEIVKLYKQPGETPLECLKRYTSESGWTYLGRLDPLAEGVLLIARDISDTERARILALPKRYRFDVLYGHSTDTGDIMGLITKTGITSDIPLPDTNILIGTYEQPYPVYSSRKVGGTPLFVLAKKHALPDVIPTKTVRVESLAYTGRRAVSGDMLLRDIHTRVHTVRGDFRQEEILNRWNEVINTNAEYFVDSFGVTGTSGLYVRNLAERIGGSVPALAYSIVRTGVGEYTSE